MGRLKITTGFKGRLHAVGLYANILFRSSSDPEKRIKSFFRIQKQDKSETLVLKLTQFILAKGRKKNTMKCQ